MNQNIKPRNSGFKSVAKGLAFVLCLLLLTHCATDETDGGGKEEFANFDESATTQASTDTASEDTIEKEMRDSSTPPQNATQAQNNPPAQNENNAQPPQEFAQNDAPPAEQQQMQQSPDTPPPTDDFAQFDKAPEPTPPPLVENNSTPPPVKEAAQPTEPPPPPPKVEEAQAVPPPAPASPVEKAAKPILVRNLQFKANDGGGALSIEASGPFTYTTRMNPATHQFVIDIPNAKVSKTAMRGLNTKDFAGTIGSVDSYQSSEGSARVVVQLRDGASEPLVNQEGNTLIVSGGGANKAATNPSIVETAPSQQPDVSNPETQTASSGGSVLIEDNAPAKILSTTSLREFLSGNQRFYGKKISFEANDADIKDLFKFLSEESGINLVLDESVQGRVTVRFREVPWDQVFFVLMQQKGLGYIRSGQILRVTKLEELKKQEDDYQKLELDRDQILPLVVKSIPISYARVGEIVSQATPFLSTAKRAKIVADPRTSTILVSDIPEGVARIEKIIKSLDTPPLQVLIEGKIVEALDTFTHFMGINWSGNGGSPQTIGYNSLGAPNNLSLLANNGLPSGHAPILDLKLTALTILGDIDAALALGETTSEVRILSSPRIMTMQNEAASITQSVNIPYTTNNQTAPGQPGTGSTVQIAPQVAFLTTQLSLNVTPQITNDASVILTVNFTRSFADAKSPSAAAPSTESRNAVTKIMVKNGQTAVIGGIYQSDSTLGKSGLPVLDDIPVLGWLFKSEEVNKQKNELLVFITPRILGQADLGISTLSTIGSSNPRDSSVSEVKTGSIESEKTGL